MYRKGKRTDRHACIGTKHFKKNIFKQVLTEVSLWGFVGGRGNMYASAYTLGPEVGKLLLSAPPLFVPREGVGDFDGA